MEHKQTTMGRENMNSRNANSADANCKDKEECDESDNESEGGPNEGLFTGDTLTNEKLQKLEEVFAEADEDGGGGLDMEEFRQAMRQSMGRNISNQDLDQIFMKVDTNCDGTVDWDEYLTYMLLECREKDIMNVKSQQPFPQPLRNCKPSGHRDSVVRILFMPTYSAKSDKDDLSTGRYVSVSRDGIICFWSLTLKLGAVHKVEAPPPRTKDIWITDACYIPGANYIGLTTTARDILFFEVSPNGLRFNKLSRINGLETCASKLSYWDGGLTENSVLFFGDCRGGVGAVCFKRNPQHTVINAKGNKNTSQFLSIAFAKIIKGDVDGMYGYFNKKLHGDEVRQIMYCPPLGCFLSCSGATDTALFLGDLNQRLHKSYFTVVRGVYCFDYSYSLNVIVTGGYDTIVRVWNPYVPTKPSIHLQGHQTPVLHVIINNPREQVISMSESNEIRIHDMNTQVCLQTFYRKLMFGLGRRPILALFFNHTKQDLVMATKTLAILEQRNIEFSTPYIQSQETPITAALYNPLFKQVVSVGEDAMICVWSITNGDKVIKFSANKTMENENPDEGGKHSEVTAMTFDPTFRRLLTAAKDGAVKIWNFNNGACLRELPIYDEAEITSIVCPKQKIITGGWNKRLTEYVDQNDDDATRWLSPPHRNDILHMALYPPHMLATCSYDGDIFIWSLDIGRLMYCLNVHTSIYPQTLTSWMGSSVQATTKSSEEYLKEAANTSRRRGVICKMPGANMLDLDTKPRVQFSSKTSTPTDDDTVDEGSTPNNKKSRKIELLIGEDDEDSPAFSPQFSEKRRKSVFQPRYDDGEYAPPPTTKFQFAVEKLVFLQTRSLKKDTATLLAGHSDGFVRAWSVHHKGRLLGEFLAAHSQDETLTAMVTDSKNKFVVTGDSGGYIKVWGIANYCVELDSENPPTLDEELQEEYNNFPFVKWRELVKKTCKKMKGWLANPRFDDGSYPLLITSFRGHLSGAVSLDIAELSKQTLIVSAASDNSIRLWSIQGEFLGIFGVKKWWIGVDYDGLTKQHPKQKIQKSKRKEYSIYNTHKETAEDQISSIPSDIRRVASATTLRILNSGNKDYKFKLPRLVMRWIAKITARGFTKDGKKMARDLFGTRDVQAEPMHISNVSEMELEKETLGKSEILKGAYKRTTRHRKLPVLPNMTRNPFTNTVCVYRSLPYSELDPVPTIPMPEAMREIIQRNAGMQQAKDAEKAKQLSLKTATGRRKSHSRPHSRQSRKSVHSSSKRRESSTSVPSGSGTSQTPPSGSGSSQWSATSSLYENLASNSSIKVLKRGPSRRLSTRIVEVLDETGPSIKTTRLPPIVPKPGETKIEAARNRVNKKLEAIRDAYE